MRISKIKIKNFRQLKDLEIEFEKQEKRDLHIFLGQNGAGKSNLMNALNWCLYSEQPHLSMESKNLPILNLKTIEHNEDSPHTSVEIWVEADKLKKIIFERKAFFSSVKKGEKPVIKNENFEVRIIKSDGNTEIFEDESAKEYVNKFVPERIREFFFFDGDRLDNYLVKSTSERISKNTFEISHIDVLEDTEDHLDKIAREYSKEAGRIDPDIDEINNRIDELEDQEKELKGYIDNCNEQIENSDKIIKDNEKFLRGIPDLEKKEKEYEKLMERKNKKEDKLQEQKKEKMDLLIKYSKLIFASKPREKTIKIIKEKRENNDLPPNINLDVLQEILDEDTCIVCDRDLNEDSRKRIEKEADKLKMSSEISNRLIEIESTLKSLDNDVTSFEKDLKKITGRIKDTKEDLKAITTKMKKIDSEISGFNDEEIIKEKHSQLKDNREIKEKNIENKAIYNERLKKVKEDLEDKREDLEDALSDSKRVAYLEKKYNFALAASNKISKIKEKIMKDVKDRIEEETKDYFFDLVWKKNTFKDLKIDDQYNLSLIHRLGYDFLGSVSAAERELLALSFTLALHKVSGFDAPIIIDTPVSRVSDINRENFTEVLVDVSKNKQVILLFTPDEYSENVQNIINKIDCQKRKIKPGENEIQSAVEVI